MKLEPNFEDLNNPETIIKSVNELKCNSGKTPHTEILKRLIEQFEPVDFEILVNPKIIELREQLEQLPYESEKRKDISKQLNRIKVTTKHLIIITIEQILKIAEGERWGLCKNHDFIYLYNGDFWTEIEKDGFQSFLGESAEKMGVGWENARHFQFRDQLYKQFITIAVLPKPENNKDLVLINLQNGTFEISQNGTKLRPFERSDFITYQLPFEYNPQAKAPLFQAYLNKVWPDIERQKVLAEYLGYIFIKHGSKSLKEEKALILYGPGANGKSVFFEIVTAMFGRENVSNFSLQNLTEEKGFYRARISNKLINYASEINGKLETSLFKAMVSGEPVEACLKYGQPFTMTDYAKFIFNCNELPKDVEHTNAYFRRFLIIPCDVTIPEQEQDKTLHTKIIEAELSGVFNWVLEGLNRLLEQKKFSDCKASVQALEQYKIESNSVQMFLNENEFIKSSQYFKLIKELYPIYKNFCNEDGMHSFSKKNFTKQLRVLGFAVERVSQNQLAVFIESPNY